MSFAQLATKRSSSEALEIIFGRNSSVRTKENAARWSGVHNRLKAVQSPQAIALMRAARRDTRRAAAFLVDDVLGRAALDLRLRGAQRGRGGLLVAGLDRLLDLLDRAAHAAAARGVHGGAALGLAGALLGRLVTSHLILVPRKGALIRAGRQPVNPAKSRRFSGVSRLPCACRRRPPCPPPDPRRRRWRGRCAARSARPRPASSRRRG